MHPAPDFGDNLDWRISSFSGSTDCVALARTSDGIALRSTNDEAGPVVMFTPAEIEAFLAGAKDGEFDSFAV